MLKKLDQLPTDGQLWMRARPELARCERHNYLTVVLNSVCQRFSIGSLLFNHRTKFVLQKQFEVFRSPSVPSLFLEASGKLA